MDSLVRNERSQTHKLVSASGLGGSSKNSKLWIEELAESLLPGSRIRRLRRIWGTGIPGVKALAHIAKEEPKPVNAQGGP